MWRNWAIIRLLWSSLILVESKLFELSTKNVAVAVGQPSIIICHSSLTANISQLHFTPLWSTKELPIWSSEIGTDSKYFRDPFAVFKGHSNVTLYIHSTSLNSAGTFTWRATSAIGESVYLTKSIAHLIVLDGNLTCNSSIRGSALQEFESVEMQCNIGYRGNWAPVMEWKFSGKDGQMDRKGIESIHISNLSVASVFNFTVSHTMNNRNVCCKTYFSNYTGNVTTTATNVPIYSYTWTSPPLNITYGPKNAIITPVRESYKPGDKLTCSADANPIPIYEWKDMSTFPSLTTGPDYTIPSSVSPFTVECTATNSFGSNSSSVKINVSSRLEPQMYLLISLGILCFLLLLLIVLISGKQIKGRCAICCAKRKRQRISLNMDTNSNANIPEVTQHTDLHVAGMTLPGHEMGNSRFTPPGKERHSTLYASVNKKVKKQKKVESDSMTTMIPQLTYLGADGTEYLEMGRFGSHPAGFAHQDKHPPPMRPRQYEPVVYASIDHNLSAPQSKKNQY